MSEKTGNKRASDRQSQKNRGRSAYSMVLEDMVTVNIGGRPRKLAPDEALQFKTYEDAINGSYSDTKTVLGWINEREAARKIQEHPRAPIKIEFENQDPIPVDQALLLLGIAVEDERASVAGKRYLRLSSWAVQDALDRKRSWNLTARDLLDLHEHTDNPERVCWPKAS